LADEVRESLDRAQDGAERSGTTATAVAKEDIDSYQRLPTMADTESEVNKFFG
jgi:hypothetical protein